MYDVPPAREPMFNIPGIVLICGALMAGIHLFRDVLLSPQANEMLLIWLAFIPLRYLPEVTFPGSPLAEVWTFGTYALLHGDLLHLLVNLFWMAAFGSALAKRFGPTRFVAFSLVCAATGAALHLMIFWGNPVPMVGASAAISGHMAAVARFGFSPGGPMERSVRLGGQGAWSVRALSIGETFRNRRALIFLAVWFGINLVFGIGGGSLVGDGASIAWQAHIGGFLGGLLLFRFFDPANHRPSGPSIHRPDRFAA